MALLGAHLSAAGDVSHAVSAAHAAGCEALQLFLRPPGRWAARALADDEVARFRAAATGMSLEGRCYAHAPYLLNVASSDVELRERSIAVLADELERAGRLGLAGVVLHPGSGRDGDREAAVARCREGLARAVDKAGPRGARLLLEGTAGAGEQLGRSPGELFALVPVDNRGRFGVCLDTAHLWGAGYDLLGDGWERALAELAEAWGRPCPDLLHGNDTPVELGSRRDRHARPGEGRLGEGFFRRLVRDERLARVPLVLEIPPGPGNRDVASVIARLRRWEAR